MKSNVFEISGEKDCLKEILRETEKIAVYNEMNKKQALQLRLLAEELVGMLPALLEVCEGSFWIENEGNRYQLHTRVTALWMEEEERERIMQLSFSGKNAAAAGIMGKIRMAAQLLLGGYAVPSGQPMPPSAPLYNFYNMGAYPDPFYGSAWSLVSYRGQAESGLEESRTKEEWDELEKSIIANLADDVIVGIRGDEVDIIIKKEFG